MSRYKLKTDFAARRAWDLKCMRREGYPKSTIERTFARQRGEQLDQSWIDSDGFNELLTDWYQPGAKGWADLFGQRRSVPLRDINVVSICKKIISGLDRYHFEDNAHFVKECFGRVWHPECKINFPLNTVNPLKAISADVAFLGLGLSLSRWLKAEPEEELFYGHTRLIPDFFESTIPHVDIRVFDLNKYRPREMTNDTDQVPIKRLKSVLTNVIIYSHKTEGESEALDVRIQAAKQFFGMFEALKGQLGNYPLFVEKTLEDQAIKEQARDE